MMSQFQKIKSLLRLPLYEKSMWIASQLTRIKTALFYRWIFGSMGKRCSLGKPLLLHNPQYMHLGNRVVIRPGARLEVIRPFPHRIPELRIGKGVMIEQNATPCLPVKNYPRQKRVNLSELLLLDTFHSFHDPLNHPPIVSRLRDEDSYIEIGEGALIGYGCVILPNVKIGRYAVIGALSVVDKDVPDFGIVRGNPARLLQIYHAEPSE